MRRQRNDSVILGRGIVPTVGNGLSVICTDMWLHIIWLWASCGGARCPGALCGRARHMTVWTMSGGHTMCRGTSNRLLWRSSSHRGLCSARLGRIPSNPAIRGCPLSLVHHYRVYKRGLPHLAFRKDYLTCLRVFVPQATALVQCDMASPVLPGSVSVRHARSSEQESESPRKTRRARRRIRPTRVRDEHVGVESLTMTVQDISNLAGAIIYDCRPPLLPVSLRLKDIGLLP